VADRLLDVADGHGVCAEQVGGAPGSSDPPGRRRSTGARTASGGPMAQCPAYRCRGGRARGSSSVPRGTCRLSAERQQRGASPTESAAASLTRTRSPTRQASGRWLGLPSNARKAGRHAPAFARVRAPKCRSSAASCSQGTGTRRPGARSAPTSGGVSREELMMAGVRRVRGDWKILHRAGCHFVRLALGGWGSLPEVETPDQERLDNARRPRLPRDRARRRRAPPRSASAARRRPRRPSSPCAPAATCAG
jgi:hypothetical protein